ncbi:MAG TPA: AtpZ/AtpI family protein [Candidatus Binataceae bacterium]|jgi:F0F1-type ATP synthase assembly protein I|nr:AtpZ/AtpI family protein [Candidatus Binataceae bacterium]
MSEPRNTPSGGRGQNLRLAAVGIEFFSTILGLLILGYALDTYLHTGPWLGVIGVVLGMVIGIYRLIGGLRHLDR